MPRGPADWGLPLTRRPPASAVRQPPSVTASGGTPTAIGWRVSGGIATRTDPLPNEATRGAEPRAGGPGERNTTTPSGPPGVRRLKTGDLGASHLRPKIFFSAFSTSKTSAPPEGGGSGGYSLATAFGLPLHIHCSHQSVALPRESSCPFFVTERYLWSSRPLASLSFLRFVLSAACAHMT